METEQWGVNLIYKAIISEKQGKQFPIFLQSKQQKEENTHNWVRFIISSY